MQALHTLQADFLYQHEGSIGLLYPVTDEARAWVEEHISDDAQWFGSGLVIEWRYVDHLIGGITDDGLEVRPPSRACGGCDD
jgi:hypothetical protein